MQPMFYFLMYRGQHLGIMFYSKLKNVDISPSPTLNFIIGQNGSGKSSFLEAIHYLGFGRSFRTSKHKNVIQYEQQRFSLFTLSNTASGTLKLGMSRGADDSLLVEEKVISNQIAAQLHFENAQSIQWQERLRTRYNPTNQIRLINPNQEYWQAFEATWESGGACTAILSTHSPDSCLPLTGLTQINPPPGQAPTIITIQVENREISFEVYEFTKNRKKLYVFRCFWPRMQAIGQANQFPKGGYSFDGRIQATLEGRRNVGGTMLALALANVDSPQTALAKLQALANQRLSFGEKEVQ